MTDETTAKPATKRARKMARAPETKVQKVAQEGEGSVVVADPKPAKPPSKTALILGMLQRSEGATLEQLVEATGWQPHTTRAALTGLRKKGHVVVRSKVDNQTHYTIAPAQTQ